MVPKVLIANRGEIAIRILRAAEELEWETVAVYTENDASHASFAQQQVKLNSVADYLDIDHLIDIAVRTGCSHVHPGYGFLSESSAFAIACSTTRPPLTFIGPSIDTLHITGDKMLSRELAASLSISVAPGSRVYSIDNVQGFVDDYGLPIIIKALDGGGGRGIRVVEAPETLNDAFNLCLGESPSKQVYVEKALLGPEWKHIEVQIVGDGREAVHLWERECSIQRRFQKIVEVAPSTLPRSAVQPLFDASLKMARKLRYKGLGTFEFLVNTYSSEWVFLEVNPRIQVEHTVTEEVVELDLLRTQLLLSIPSTTLSSLNLHLPSSPPRAYAIQLRLTAEDPLQSFRLSTGTVCATDFSWPSGRGVRVDTWLTSGSGTPNQKWVVGPDFDSLLAKIIVRGGTFEEATQRARRVLKEIFVGGEVKTNVDLLLGIVLHPDWGATLTHTTWLEGRLEEIVAIGRKYVRSAPLPQSVDMTGQHPLMASSSIMLQPGALFHLYLSSSDSRDSTAQPIKHTVSLPSIAHNSFPIQLSGAIQTSLAQTPMNFTLTQSSSVAVTSASAMELADPNNPNHVASPMTGKIVELHPALLAQDQQRSVVKGETIVVLSVMKMETVIVAPFDGIVHRVGRGVEPGAIVNEGTLLTEIECRDIRSRL